jgi:hypothetical protein
MRKVSRKTDRLPQRFPPYTPTPNGFERCLRAWVGLPMDDVPIPGAGDASASPKKPETRDQVEGTSRTRKGHRRRRGGRPDA